MVKLKPGTIWPTLEEDAAITAAAQSDPDNPPLTDEDFARMRPMREVHPDLVEAWEKERAEDAALEKDRMKISLRLVLDLKVVEAFQAQGPDWEERMREVLRRAAGL